MRKSSPLISPKGILGAVTVAAVALLNLQPAGARDNGIATRSYVKTNLVSDIAGMARVTDPHLKNPWGMAASPNTPTSPGSPLWVSDNHAGASTVYDGAGNPQPSSTNPLVVSIPAPQSAGSDAVGAPDGMVFNTFDRAASDFVIAKDGASGPSFFLWATEDGTIVGWNPSVDRTHAVIAVDRSTETDSAGDVGAVYKGLALVATPAGKFLYASNFRFGTVEAFDSNFKLVNSFTDPTVPAGFAPFGIHNIGGQLYVTFALQGAGKMDDDAGPGNGFVDVFAPNGVLLQRFASRGKLDSPWAVTLAPSSFGVFGGDILVGNFGDGRINAFDPTSGAFLGQLRDAGGRLRSLGCGGSGSGPVLSVSIGTHFTSQPGSTTRPTDCWEISYPTTEPSTVPKAALRTHSASDVARLGPFLAAVIVG
jgi:uncharacterized protein (TIGR03118 family)